MPCFASAMREPKGVRKSYRRKALDYVRFVEASIRSRRGNRSLWTNCNTIFPVSGVRLTP